MLQVSCEIRPTLIIMLVITRKGGTPVEGCKCNQYEIRLKPRRVPVINKTKITCIIIIIAITISRPTVLVNLAL